MDRRPDDAAAATDSALVAAVLDQRDEAAFRTLYRRHTPRLYLMVLRMLGGRVHDAEDVIQETWLHAVAGLARFRWEARFSTWLTSIGLNVVRSRRRSRGARRETPLEGELSESEGSGPAVTLEGRIDLERAIALLPDGCREVLVLHDIEGWTHGEISRFLDISEGTSKSQLHHARRRMRTLMGARKEEVCRDRQRTDT